jgi:hypothetical protein
MNTSISHLLETFVRVRDFGAEHAGAFRSDSLAPDLFEAVAQAAAEITKSLTAQTSGIGSVQQATVSRAGAREALRADMHAIARTARVMALDTPGLENKFRLPRGGGDQALLQAARTFAAEAVAFKAEFIRHEMPNSFIEDLLSDIANLERTMGGQVTGREAHISASVSIEEMAERGMNAVRRLDAIVRNRFRDEPAVLAAWEYARHVARPARAPKRTNSKTGGNQGEGEQHD